MGGEEAALFVDEQLVELGAYVFVDAEFLLDCIDDGRDVRVPLGITEREPGRLDLPDAANILIDDRFLTAAVGGLSCLGDEPLGVRR